MSVTVGFDAVTVTVLQFGRRAGGPSLSVTVTSALLVQLPVLGVADRVGDTWSSSPHLGERRSPFHGPACVSVRSKLTGSMLVFVTVSV